MKEQIILQMFKNGVRRGEIAKTVELSKQRITQILIKHGLKERNFNYSKKISLKNEVEIERLNREGQTATEIGKAMGVTPAAIRAHLKKKNLQTNIKTADTSRPCVVCGTVFSPKYSDGIKKDKYKTCSKSCTKLHLSALKTKYDDKKIKQVIELKKQFTPNFQIVNSLGVNINKVKEIVRHSKLYLTPEKAQKNAYEAKISANPNSMSDMRAVYHAQAGSEQTLQDIEKILLDRGFQYISGFQMKSKPFVIKCLTCQQEKEISKINTVVKGSCSGCAGTGTSVAENEIKNWVEGLGLKTEKYKFASPFGGKEIDIYIPNLKIGIEYCGLYWHNEKSPTPRDNNYHHSKMRKANKDGIRLITIFEDEWEFRKEQVKSFLLSTFGKNSKTIYARNTQVSEVPAIVARDFMKKYHIQGSTFFRVALGLYFQGQLVGLITGNQHHRNGYGDTFILNRLVFKTDISVVGGTSKLLNSLLIFAKNAGYSKLVSWSDNRWSEGRVYEKIGFVLENESRPDYSYVDGRRRIPKQACQKNFYSKKALPGTPRRKWQIL